MEGPASTIAERSDWRVPAYERTEFSARRQRYCIAVFVINEGSKLHAQLERMRPYADQIDIVIADGGSTDGSVTPEELQPRGVRALLVKRAAGRLGAQMRMAFAWALEQAYYGVVTIDGNNKDDPAAIPAFIAALDAGVDHVQGSRFITGGQAINTPLSRLIGVRMIHAPLVSLAAGVRYTDTTNGFRGYSRRLLLDPRVSVFREVFNDYELHYYLAIRAGELGYTVREVPVTRAYPEDGPIPTKIHPITGNARVLKSLIASYLHRFDPPRVAPATDGR